MKVFGTLSLFLTLTAMYWFQTACSMPVAIPPECTFTQTYLDCTASQADTIEIKNSFNVTVISKHTKEIILREKAVITTLIVSTNRQLKKFCDVPRIYIVMLGIKMCSFSVMYPLNVSQSEDEGELEIAINSSNDTKDKTSEKLEENTKAEVKEDYTLFLGYLIWAGLSCAFLMFCCLPVLFCAFRQWQKERSHVMELSEETVVSKT